LVKGLGQGVAEGAPKCSDSALPGPPSSNFQRERVLKSMFDPEYFLKFYFSPFILVE
jgi:hypothetical protein